MAHGLRYYSSLRFVSSHWVTDLPATLVPHLHRAFHSRLPLSTRVPTLLSYRSTGISTCCPSATTLVLALGPDLPRADQLYPGNLGYSAVRIPTLLSLLIPAFSLPCSPQLLPVLLPPACNALYQPGMPCQHHDHTVPLMHEVQGSARRRSPCCWYDIPDSSASVARFSPGHFRRRTSRPVSYYALFECMAASEPTSWLSSKSHILFHLTRTLGP